MTRAHFRLIALLSFSALATAGMIWNGSRETLGASLSVLEQYPVAFTCAFTVWALIANCLIVPAGSLSLIIGGAALGTFLPAAIWFAAQLASAPFIHRAASDRVVRQRLIERYLGASATKLMARAARDGIWASVVLRLTPILPSAPAALIAAGIGISLRSFLIGSSLAGWVRPLYFASIGAAAGSYARAENISSTSGITAPLIVLGCVSIVLFAARLYASCDEV